MRRNWVLLNIALCILALSLAYQLRRQWQAYRDTHSSAKIQPPKPTTPQLPTSASKGAVAPNYSAIVDKHLFNLERNNMIPAEPQVAAPKVLAPKPILMGTMGLAGNTYALMVSGSAGDSTLYRRIKIGEQLDGYTLVRVMHDKVVMNADGKEVDVSVAEQPRPRSQPPATDGGSVAGSGSRVSAVGSAGNASATTARPDAPQIPPGDAPEGTLFNGRRKRIVPSPFGPTVVWEDAK